MTATFPAPTVHVGHPLEPLSAGEVAVASALLRELKGLAPTARFVFVTLHERAERHTYKAVVSLTTGDLVA
jgi:Cu2+-containing amine oxidase